MLILRFFKIEIKSGTLSDKKEYEIFSRNQFYIK